MACTHRSQEHGNDSCQTRPRLTKTMRLVYAIMRGQLSENRGPLYSPLSTPRGCRSENPVDSEASSINTGHFPQPGQVNEACTSIPGMQGQSTLPTPPHSRLHSPFQVHIRHEPLRKVGSSHVGSSQALADYGYLEVNGKWVDPDSEGSIFNAFNGLSSENSPEISELYRSSSPCILLEPQLSLEYTFFAMYVDDGEGDPRDLRISPDTFAKWAEGAVERGRTGQTSLVPEPMARGPRRKVAELAKEIIHFTPQFDLVTGEQLSPVYSIEESPIPLLSPQGVNNNQYPQSFSYSYPLADLQYKRATYYNAGIPISPPVSPTIESFTSEGIWDALASEGDSQSGLRHAQELRQCLEQITQERNVNVAEVHRVAALNRCIRGDVSELSRDVALLQANIDNIKKAKRRRRYLAQIGQYMERVAHTRDQAFAVTKALNETNERLREKAGKLVTERQDLLNSLAV